MTGFAVVLAIGAGLGFVNGFRKISDAPHVTAPGAATYELQPGTNAVYENGEYSRLDASNVQVVGSDGRSVPVRPAPISMSVGINDTNYTEIAAFDVPTAGSYVVIVSGSSSFVAVAPDITPSLLRAISGGLAAFVLGIAGSGLRRFGRRRDAR